MLDASNSPVAQQFKQMIEQSEQTHRQQIITQLNSSAPVVAASQGAAPSPSNYWFMNQPAGAKPQHITDGTTPPSKPAALPADEQTLAASIKARNHQQDVSYSHLRTLRPLDNTPVEQAAKAEPNPATAPSTQQTDPAILSLASNNDLNVATLARQAKKAKGDDLPPHDEVVISLR
jgi:hypothetical protein